MVIKLNKPVNTTEEPNLFVGHNKSVTEQVYQHLSLSNQNYEDLQLTDCKLIHCDVSGVKIFAWQQTSLLESLGLIVFPDNN